MPKTAAQLKEKSQELNSRLSAGTPNDISPAIRVIDSVLGRVVQNHGCCTKELFDAFSWPLQSTSGERVGDVGQFLRDLREFLREQPRQLPSQANQGASMSKTAAEELRHACGELTKRYARESRLSGDLTTIAQTFTKVIQDHQGLCTDALLSRLSNCRGRLQTEIERDENSSLSSDVSLTDFMASLGIFLLAEQARLHPELASQVSSSSEQSAAFQAASRSNSSGNGNGARVVVTANRLLETTSESSEEQRRRRAASAAAFSSVVAELPSVPSRAGGAGSSSGSLFFFPAGTDERAPLLSPQPAQQDQRQQQLAEQRRLIGEKREAFERLKARLDGEHNTLEQLEDVRWELYALKDMFDDVQQRLVQQGVRLEVVASNAEEARENVEEGTKNLESAERVSRGDRRREDDQASCCCCFSYFRR